MSSEVVIGVIAVCTRCGVLLLVVMERNAINTTFDKFEKLLEVDETYRDVFHIDKK